MICARGESESERDRERERGDVVAPSALPSVVTEERKRKWRWVEGEDGVP